MGLINLKTNLKNLKYGKDTLSGGYSGQPYIQTPIPEDFNDLGAREDFILRGGANTARDTATDVLRLTKMFSDLKSPNGVLFISKQNILSQTAVRTQSSGIVNEGIYSPLNTLAQAGVVISGGHLNKQGDPFAETGAYSNNDNLYGVKVKSTQNTDENRLAKLYRLSFTNGGRISIKLDSFELNNGVNVLSYNGGPNSILGVGKTNIRYADQRTGINNYQAKDPNLQSYFNGTYKKIIEPGDYLKNINSSKGVSSTFISFTNTSLTNPYNNLGKLGNGYENFNVYLPDNNFPKNSTLNSTLINNNNTFTYSQRDIIKPYEAQTLLPFIEDFQSSDKQGSISSPKIQDFRKVLREKLQGTQRTEAEQTGATPLAPNYSGKEAKNIENRVLLGDPGQRSGKSYANYTKGINYGSIDAQSGNTPLGNYKPGLDKITSIPIYRSQNVASAEYVNDLVKFRIAVIDNDSPNFKTFIHFRAFLDSMSDSYNSTWNGFNYLGRGEQFYTYGGFNRQISLSWTVAAQSKQELIPMYKKLNYLASSLAPDYSPNGYMRGNLVQLTVGGYVYEQPGFITSLTYDVPTESPWELGINTDGNNDSTVKELPHIIKVTGFSFTPIQRFIPKLQNNTYTFNNNTTGSTDDDFGFTKKYGPERYISLANGNNIINNNYDRDRYR
jgi:hypothetical protein